MVTPTMIWLASFASCRPVRPHVNGTPHDAQDGFHPGEDLGLAARHDGKGPLLRPDAFRRRPGIDVMDCHVREMPSVILRLGRLDGAHVDDDGAGAAGPPPPPAEQHVGDDGAILQHQDDESAPGRPRRGIDDAGPERASASALSRDRFQTVSAITRLEQPLGLARSHETDTEKATVREPEPSSQAPSNPIV